MDRVLPIAQREIIVSAFDGAKNRTVRRNVDLTPGMLRDLDERAARLNISRQAVIKTMLARAMSEEDARPKKAS